MEEVKAKLDMSQVRQELDSTVEAWNKYKSTLGELVAAQTKLDKSGNVLESTVKKIVKDGVEVTQTWRQVKGVMELATTSIKDNTQAIKDQDAITEKAIATQRRYRDEALKSIHSIRGGRGQNYFAQENAARPEVLDVKRAEESLIQVAQKHQLTAKQILQIWNEVQSGIYKTYSDARFSKARDELVKLATSWESVGSAARKAIMEQQRQNQVRFQQQSIADHQSNVNLLEHYAQRNARIEEENIARRARVSAEAKAQSYGEYQTNVMLAEHWARVHEATEQRHIAARQKAADAAKKQAEANKKNTDSLKDNKTAVEHVMLSWENFARLAVYQVAHRVIYKLLADLRSGIEEAQKLMIAIAEIQTIDTSNSPFSRWEKTLLDLSSKYGFDVLDEAEAGYQALSNQVIKSAAEFKLFGETVNRFAVSAVTDTATSVNLLTGVMNAYHLSTAYGEEISAKLFKTIELGRVRADEMAETFGNIAVLGYQLGISLDDLLASIATVTIQGIKYREAATQIRGIMMALIKPGEGMKQFFRDIGVESGEAAVKTFTFAGIMDKIQKYTGNASNELAELIPRIRGISGMLAMTGEGFAIYNDNLIKIQNSLKEYGSRVDIVMANAGKKLNIEIQEMKKYFREVGISILETSGGFQGLSEVTVGFAQIAASAVIPVIIALTMRMNLLRLATLGAMAANPYGALIIGGTLAIYLIGSIIKGLDDVSKEEQKAYEKWKEDIDKVYLEDEAKRGKALNQFKEYNDLRFRSTAQLAAEMNSLLNKEIDAEYELVSEAGKHIVSQMSLVKESIKETIDSIKENIRTYDAAIKTLTNRYNDIEPNLAKVKLEMDLTKLEGDPQAQLKRLQDEYISLDKIFQDPHTNMEKLHETYTEMANIRKQQFDIVGREVKDKQRELTKDIKDFEDEAKRLEDGVRKRNAERYKDSPRNVRQRVTNLAYDLRKDARLDEQDRADLAKARELRAQAEETRKSREAELANLQQQFIKLESLDNLAKQYADRTIKMWDAIDKQKKKQEQKQLEKEILDRELDPIKTVLQEFQKDQKKLFTEETDPKKIAERTKEYVTAQQRLVEIARGGKLGGSEDEIKNYITSIRQNMSDVEREAQNRIDFLKNKEIQDNIDKEKQNSVNLITQLKSRIDAHQKYKDSIDDMFKRAPLLLDNRGGASFALFESLKQLGMPIEEAANDTGKFNQEVENLANNIRKLRDGENIDTNVLLKDINAIRWELGTVNTKGLTDEQREKFTNFKNFITELENVLQDPRRLVINRVLKQERELYEQLTGNITVAQTNIKNITEAAVEALTNESQVTAEIADNFARSATNLNSLNAELRHNIAIEQERKARGMAAGGLVYFSNGGFTPRGTDIVPAMLTPGEFVVNKAASQRFYSQLVAMNNAVRPNYYAAGGSVDVGGINVTVNDSSSPERTANAVVREINRGIKHGRIKLRR